MHCKYVLVEYVQAHEDGDPKNNNSPRSIDCLCLTETSNYQGVYDLLQLQTNRVIQEIRLLPFQFLYQSLNKYIHWKNLI